MRSYRSPDPVTLRTLVAGNLRRLRTEAGAEPDDLLPSAHANGLDWTATWVSGVEKGTRALTAEQLLALPVVLSAALRQRVTLADLLRGDAPVRLGRGAETPTVPASYLREVAGGEQIKRR